MSMEVGGQSYLDATGVPELTELGKRIEVLRIDRGLSKQHLARFAGTSRQQLWRVMTGKSELTGSLRQRLADVLQVDGGLLVNGPAAGWTRTTSAAFLAAGMLAQGADLASPPAVDFSAFLADPTHLERALVSLPTGDPGSRVKRALLNALEDVAVEHALSLAPHFFELRRKVLAGEL